jgi:hypothetical protein
MLGGICLTAAIMAFRMAWTDQHRKLATAGILLNGFGLLHLMLPALARGLGF